MFNLSKNFGLYYSWSEAFVQQLLSQRERGVAPAFAKPAGPLTGNGWEAGVMFSLFKGKLSGSLAGFKAEEKNRVQVTGEDKFGFHHGVVKSQPSKGGELDVIITPIPNWQTLLAVSANETNVVNLDRNDPNGTRAVPASNVPGWQAKLFSRYNFTEGFLKGLTLGLGWEIIDDYRTKHPRVIFGGSQFVFNNHKVGYQVFDALLGYSWTWGERTFSLRVNIKNIHDARYFSGGNTWGNPRNAEMTFKVEF